MRNSYSQDIPLFRYKGEIEQLTLSATHAACDEGQPVVLVDVFGRLVPLQSAEPVSVAAVLMYEAAGGTLEDARVASGSRPGRKPDGLFARAHARAAVASELGRGC